MLFGAGGDVEPRLPLPSGGSFLPEDEAGTTPRKGIVLVRICKIASEVYTDKQEGVDRE